MMLPAPKVSPITLLSAEIKEILSQTETNYPSENRFSLFPLENSSVLSNEAQRHFQCHKCSGLFISFKGLRQHIGKKHNSNKKYSPCKHCNKKFRTKYAVKFHIKQVHEKSTRVVCELCGADFYNKYMLRTHHHI